MFMIIQAKDTTWHLQPKSFLVEVGSTLRVWREWVENIAGAASATINQSEAVSF